MFARFQSLLIYDPLAGVISWRERRLGVNHGLVAGVLNAQGYRVIRVDGKLYRANRIAWCLQTGEWPLGQVDHVNGVRDDDRWANLRLATQTQNNGNARLRRDNRLGVKGVRRKAGKFVAEIKCDGKRKHLGYFSTPEAAHAAYFSAAQQAFGEFARAR